MQKDIRLYRAEAAKDYDTHTMWNREDFNEAIEITEKKFKQKYPDFKGEVKILEIWAKEDEERLFIHSLAIPTVIERFSV